MLAKVCSAAVNGIEAYPVEVEVNAGWGDTLVVIVGLPDAAVKESRDRVSTALTNSGFKFPMGRTTVNLAPADVDELREHVWDTLITLKHRPQLLKSFILHARLPLQL